MASPLPKSVPKETPRLTPDAFRTIDTVKKTFDDLNLRFNSGRGYLNKMNEDGTMAWREAPIMEAYLSMYELTRESSYLEQFIVHADEVAKKRDSVTGRKTYDGKSLPAWPSSGHYTLGTPAVIPDRDGQPSIEIQTYGWTDNGSVAVTIEDGAKPGTYRISATRDSPRLGNLKKTYPDLTQQTVERQINFTGHKEQLVRVKVLGKNRPANTKLPPPQTSRYIFAVQTGVIAAAYARFSWLVKQNELHGYDRKAREYIQIAADALSTHDDEWRETSNSRGHYFFRRNAPVWSDGIVVPYNYMFAMGRAYVLLYAATGKNNYKERVEKILNAFTQGNCPAVPKGAEAVCLKVLKNGTLVWPYWGEEGHSGWTADEDRSTHTPRHAGQKAIEDVGHGALDYAFFVDAYQHGIGFDMGDMKKLAETVKLNIFSRLPEFPKYINGTGDFEDAYFHLGHYISMTEFDPSIAPMVEGFIRNPKSKMDGNLSPLANIALQLKRAGRL